MTELGVTIKATEENPDLGDLMLTNGREVVLTVLGKEVAQRLSVRFMFFKGEWLYNVDEGTPYFENILVKGPSDRAIRTILTDVIQSTAGVSHVVSLTYTISKTRVMSVKFKCVLEDASVFSTTDYGEFVVADV